MLRWSERKSRGNPYQGVGLGAGRVAQQLEAVGVVRLFQLVFDNHPVVGDGIPGQDINPSSPGQCYLSPLQFQFQAQLGAQQLQVLGEPGSEILRFVGPACAQALGSRG